MKLSFYGAAQCVTGSCHCLEVNGKKILVDCGLQQGRDEIDNTYLPFNPAAIDAVLITHAHIDHSGRVPMLIKNGFTGRIITTRLTADAAPAKPNLTGYRQFFRLICRIIHVTNQRRIYILDCKHPVYFAFLIAKR